LNESVKKIATQVTPKTIPPAATTSRNNMDVS
jgi:hypothetical protein